MRDGRLLQRRSGRAGGGHRPAPGRSAIRSSTCCRQWPYTLQQSYLDDTEPKGIHDYWRTEYLSGLSEEMLTACRDAWSDLPGAHGADHRSLHVEGALNERAADDGAVGNRDVRYVYGVTACGSPSSRRTTRAEEYVAWARTSGADLRPFVDRVRTYVNFQSPTRTTSAGSARPTDPTGTRLVEVKRRYDPGNLFRSNRNIEPS